MNVRLAFGTHGLTASLPDGFNYHVLEVRAVTPLPDPSAELERALAPLDALAKRAATAAIAVCDITRPVPNRFILPPLLDRLHRAGIPPDAVTIIIATGLHRGATHSEIRGILGDEIATRYTVVNHNARESNEHIDLGETASGTPVAIDQRFVRTGLRITLGLIEPHLMAGYSGGRKMVAPGLAGEATIKTLHSPRFMRNPRAVEGSLDGNPVHEELLEISRMARHDFICDVALTRDREIAGIFAGAPEEAHARGTEFVGTSIREVLPRPVDAVITTCAGYPLDTNFYQAIKGVTAAVPIVRKSEDKPGRILLVAECAHGAGSHEFSQMLLGIQSWQHFLDHIRDKPVQIDQWQLEKLALAGLNAELLFYVPGLLTEFEIALPGRVFASLDAALHGLTEGLRPGADIAVIPEGPYVLSQVETAR